MQHPECQKLQARGELVLAGGPATLSKLASRYPMGFAPMVLEEGRGAHVWCPDGHRYVDCVAALGPVLLGHHHPAVTFAVQEQANLLSCSTLSTPMEVEVAERLCSIIPGAEMCRLASNGADVTNAAVKLARYVTGKKHVVFCGYAGGHDSYLITTDKAGGILPNIAPYNHQVTWRHLDALQVLLDQTMRGQKDAAGHPTCDLAAIMLEVPPEPLHVTREETAGMIQRYSDAAHRHGALFILDEVVTGFRYALGGAQEYYGVRADLCTFSKAMGNGLPVAAITGPRDLMRGFEGGAVFLSTTFGASCLGLAAAKATLTTLQETDALARLQQHGGAVLAQIAARLRAADLPITPRGNYARFVCDVHGIDGIASAAELRTLWLQELAKRGILAGVPWLPMTCWNGDIAQEIRLAVEATCDRIETVVHGSMAIEDALECPPITDVFQSRYVQPDTAA